MKAPVETEVKIPITDLAGIHSKLSAVGFAVTVKRVFEANTLYDRRDGELRKAEMVLRLREAGDKYVITWKGPGQPGPHKNRPELETAIGSVDVLSQILEHIGFRRSFRYEKYRTEFERSADGAGTVTIDETPIGVFMELEGPAEWIDRTAKELGFSPRDYVLESYVRLYLADCERRGVQPSNMVFAS